MIWKQRVLKIGSTLKLRSSGRACRLTELSERLYTYIYTYIYIHIYIYTYIYIYIQELDGRLCDFSRNVHLFVLG